MIKFTFIAMIAGMQVSNACATRARKSDEVPPIVEQNSQQEHQIQQKYQKAFSELFAANATPKATAYCLFSAGGWSHDGQHCVIVDSASKSTEYFAMDQGKSTFEKRNSKTVDSKILEDISQEAKKLDSQFAVAYDHLAYEYVVFKKDGPEVKRDYDLVMNAPTLPNEHQLICSRFLKEVGVKK